jgi:putative redox protein
MSEQLEITVSSTNQKVQFAGISRANPAIAIDYTPPLGDGQGYTPLELALVSLASCSGATVATLLRKMRKSVSGVKVHARGIRRDTHPTSFEKIFLEFVIDSQDAADADAQRAIQLSKESYCPVWAMLRDDIEVTCEYRIVASPGDQAPEIV